MTFFDELKSDLKQVALSQIDLDVFYEYSLLKPSQNSLDNIEFENTEFQEYLAAKEITRLPNPALAAFGFAVDPDAKEIYPTWFNALTFLVDMQTDLLEQLIEFSGMRTDEFRIVDDGFLQFLGKVYPKNVPKELRRQVFRESLDYHQRTRQWMNRDLVSALPGFFDVSLEILLKDRVTEAESESGARRYVPLGNIACIVGFLLKQKTQLDRPYWRTRLLAFAIDKNDNGVLQRHALYALGHLHDPTILDEIPNLVGSDQLIMRAFLSMCLDLDPDNPKSLRYFLDAIKAKEFHGMVGLCAAREPASIKTFLTTFNSDEDFRKNFLTTALNSQSSTKLLEHIQAVCSDEIVNLAKTALVHCTHYTVAHEAERSSFIHGMWDLLKKIAPNFITEMVTHIQKATDGRRRLHYAEEFFVRVINKDDVSPFIDAMVAIGQKKSAFHVMLKIRGLPGKSEVFEAGRSKLPEEYAQFEIAQANSPDNGVGVSDEALLQRFRFLLETEQGKPDTRAFEFYNKHAQQLDALLTGDDRNRLSNLLTDTALRIDPLKYDLKMTSGGYVTSAAIAVFRDALGAAKQLGLDTTPFRQNILNFIPFAHHEQIRTIFDLVKNVKPHEIEPVLSVYKERQSDLWHYQPSSFVQAVEQYHIIEAVPILKELVKEQACDNYTRRTALTIVDSLVPDVSFLKEVFELHNKSANEGNNVIAQVANGLLITTHGDGEAIRWRLRKVVEAASPFEEALGAHWVGKLENEIYEKSFAAPLMKLSQQGYENSYLGLLDEAMALWSRGKEYYAYSQYLWEIVYAYFDNLKVGRNYTPLRLLENKITDIKDRDGANWLAGRMVHLRRSYLGYLGKPQNISEAIRKYNDSRSLDNKKIQNSGDLFRHLQNAFDTDLRRWIEGEGAYDLLHGQKVYKGKKQQYEILVQKTLKTQVENILLRRGFQAEIIREPQLINDKRTDFLVRYGFAGPIIVEVKLTSNSDIKGSKIVSSDSYKSMKQYMQGYGTEYGIFLIIDNVGAKNLGDVTKVFESIPNVFVQRFNCSNPMVVPKKKKGTR